MEELPVHRPIAEHAERAHAGKRVGGDVEAGREIVVAIVRDRQNGDAARLSRFDGGEDIVTRKRDLLETGAAEGDKKA